MLRTCLVLLISLVLVSACGSSSSSSSSSGVNNPGSNGDSGNQGGNGGEPPEPPVVSDSDADGVADDDDNCPAIANPDQADADADGSGDVCDDDDSRDSDGDGVANNIDLCSQTPVGEAVAENGCAATEVNAACADSFASVTAGRHYQQLLQSASGERISFEVFEPETIHCGKRALAAHPLIVQAHGLGGSRVSDKTSAAFESSGIKALLEAGYVVISVDQRGFGDSSGTVRVHDPDFEGRDAIQIVDWAESNLDYLAWRDVSTGQLLSQPATATSEIDGPNLLFGAIGGSYGGGFQMLLHGVDEKQRLDAMVPNITWHHLPYSLNPGDVPKSDWMLLLVAAGEAGSYQPGFENQDSPLARGLDPYIVEGLVRALTLNEVPRDALDWLAYHSPSYWCGLNDQPVMPYQALASEINNNLTGFANELPGSNTFSGQRGVDVLLTQGIRDTLFNFNEAWWNYQCLSERAKSNGSEVRLLSHESGHIISNFIGETPDPIATQALGGKFACGDLSMPVATRAWLDEKLRGAMPLPALQDDAICMSLADDDAVSIPQAQFKARRAGDESQQPAFYQREALQLTNVLNGAGAQAAHLLGQDVVVAPLLTVTGSNGLIVAGIPQLDLSVSTPQMVNDAICAAATLPTIRSGCDSILFVGLAVARGEGEWQLLDDQITPFRGLGDHLDTDLVGIAERLAPGDRLGLWVSGYHPQYIEAFSRDVSIPVVNLSATVRLPLFAVGADGDIDLDAPVEAALNSL